MSRQHQKDTRLPEGTERQVRGGQEQGTGREPAERPGARQTEMGECF